MPYEIGYTIRNKSFNNLKIIGNGVFKVLVTFTRFFQLTDKVTSTNTWIGHVIVFPSSLLYLVGPIFYTFDF